MDVVGSSMITSLLICCRIYRWKIFRILSILCCYRWQKVMGLLFIAAVLVAYRVLQNLTVKVVMGLWLV